MFFRLESRLVVFAILFGAFTSVARGDTVFIEAETLKPSSEGWVVSTGPEVRAASGVSTLHGASGPGDATAKATITLKEAGLYRVWVRYCPHARFRGPFQVVVFSGGKETAAKVFDTEADPTADRGNPFVWKFLETELPAGDVVLRLAKQDPKTASGVTRHVDCFLITTDRKLVPDHTVYGQQTYLRVTFGDGYDRPVYMHVFADHFRAPWFKHFALARNGTTAGVTAKKSDLLKAGEQTPWCNITPMLYQDSGALLQMSVRYAYTDSAPRLKATLEFATAPDEKTVVRKIAADCSPNGLAVVVPPDLTTPENRSRLMIDRDFAEERGKLADAFAWPTFGRKPEKFPFLVRAQIEGGDTRKVDAAVTAREQKTLDYFGFTPEKGRIMHSGIWYANNGSFCDPDIERMKAKAAKQADEFKAQGRSLKEILSCRLTDEPTGQPASVLAKDPAAIEPFRAWLKAMGKSPADLLVADWEAVRPIPEEKAKDFPALHYYTQRFRTHALGGFMATQRKILEEAYGGAFPTVANFSDGAVYNGNFYAQGVDYFELLETSDGQNAVWGEDWANGSSTYQCAAFNVDLMRAATRRRGQPIGHFVISYAGRTPWDTQLRAVSELARGVKALESYYYGPVWASHEGGLPWKSSDWITKPDMWKAQAELVRQVGAAEELLLPAKAAPAEVAIIYSSASDIWTAKGNLAFGFDRMHTWLALAHAQMPADIVSETNVASGGLAGYRVCYLSGPNLTKAATQKLADWVRAGGTLWLTTEAASRDEYDQPLTVLDDLLPAKRAAIISKPFHASGRYLQSIKPDDEVTMVGGAQVEVLSVRQALQPRKGTEVLGTYKDGSAALVLGKAGKGSIYCSGFLPALAYIKAAQVARTEAGAKDSDRLSRSRNPWAYPAPLRDLLLRPVRAAEVSSPVTCNVPVVDAVCLTCDLGMVVPLSNYTLQPIDKLALNIKVDRPVSRVESARHGALQFKVESDNIIGVTLPLEATDFVLLFYAPPRRVK